MEDIDKEYYELQGSYDGASWFKLGLSDTSFFTRGMVDQFPYLMYFRLISTITGQETGKVINVQGIPRTRKRRG